MIIMKTNFEQHRENSRELSSAEQDLSAAAELMREAEENHKKASEKYMEIIEAGKDEAPELVLEAYQEHLRLLKADAAQALQNNDYEKLEAIVKNIQGVQSIYEGDERLMPTELQSSVEELLGRYRINGTTDKQHYLNRAKMFFGEGFPADRVMDVLEIEMKQPPVKVRSTEPDWLGPRRIGDDRR
jgi:hypothetical protein